MIGAVDVSKLHRTWKTDYKGPRPITRLVSMFHKFNKFGIASWPPLDFGLLPDIQRCLLAQYHLDSEIELAPFINHIFKCEHHHPHTWAPGTCH